jgi:hypothetical protein
MIIGLSGYAQSGKDTVAKILVDHYKFIRVAFADTLRGVAYKTNPLVGDKLHLADLVDEYGWDVAKQNPNVREFLQTLGLAAREELSADVWVVAALLKMSDEKKNYVVTDVRFENEAVLIKQLGGQLWRVRRPSVDAVNDHVSERALDGYKFDQVIYNSDSLESLDLLVKTRMNGLLV